jgi:hypothetical protein
VYDHNSFSKHTVVRSPNPLPAGSSLVEVHQQRVHRGPGRARLLVNGTTVGEVAIPEIPVMMSPVGMDLGRNPTGVSSAYTAPFEFSGGLNRVEIGTARTFSVDEEAAIELAAAERMQ